jgi:hypothetical protein
VSSYILKIHNKNLNKGEGGTGKGTSAFEIFFHFLIVIFIELEEWVSADNANESLNPHFGIHVQHIDEVEQMPKKAGPTKRFFLSFMISIRFRKVGKYVCRIRC